MTPAEKQKGFVPLFLFILVADFLAALALASKDEIWTHLCFIWLGPLDDIFYLIVGVQALMFLLDPSGAFSRGEKGEFSFKLTWGRLSSDAESRSIVARGFCEGCSKSLTVLPAFLVMFLILNLALGTLPGLAAQNLLYRYVSFVLPISLFVVSGFRLTGVLASFSHYWKACLLGFVAVFGVATMDGRWYNHIYHLFANLENIQAWCAAFSWAAFFTAQSADLVGPAFVSDGLSEAQA